MTEPPRPRTPYGDVTPPPKPPWLRGPEDLPPAPGTDRAPLERLRHCWVTSDEHGRVPGLLLEWRETPDGWEGRVVRPVLDMEDEKWRPREEWIPASLLEQG